MWFLPIKFGEELQNHPPHIGVLVRLGGRGGVADEDISPLLTLPPPPALAGKQPVAAGVGGRKVVAFVVVVSPLTVHGASRRTLRYCTRLD